MHPSFQGRGQWYRFTEAAGGEMASECTTNTAPITRRGQPCGAAFRGWMVDRHPTLQEGRRNARVCFSYPDKCTCEFYSNIAVRNLFCGPSEGLNHAFMPLFISIISET